MPINANNSAELPFVTDGAGLDMELSPCANCGRKFAVDRLSKHQKACKKVSKPRKQYNMTSHRIAGSGAEKYQYKVKQETKNPPKAKKKDWRAKHNEFIATIRYAKMASAVEAKGGNIADLAPPPKTDNSDYIQCPHCSRKFNETAAERHIPKCKDIKAKPTMLKKGGRR
ncbi:ZC2HC1C [Bugula neritina]|uniref:ZC2HC1C n=1 Tax=Bugula neritina TaxID=10212 RepID=A0A7J7JKE3_BUGNE|nr:ZC2HC1C [Bugula neritina]